MPKLNEDWRDFRALETFLLGGAAVVVVLTTGYVEGIKLARIEAKKSESSTLWEVVPPTGVWWLVVVDVEPAFIVVVVAVASGIAKGKGGRRRSLFRGVRRLFFVSFYKVIKMNERRVPPLSNSRKMREDP